MSSRRVVTALAQWRRWGAAGLCLLALVPRAVVSHGTDTGSLAARVVHETWTRGLPGTPVRRIAQGRDGYLLLATNGGLGRFDGNRFTVDVAPDSAHPDSLPDSYINDVIVAHDGAIWLATMHGGIVEHRNRRFRSYSTPLGLPDANVAVVYEDRHGTIWAGTQAGFGHLAGGRFVRVPDGANLNVFAFCEDADGVLWVGTDHGLKRMVNGRVVPAAIPLLDAARIVRLLRGRDGSLWVATAQGLVHMTRDRRGAYAVQRVYGTRDGIRSAFITSVVEQADGVIWVGTLGGGIARRERNDRFLSFGLSDGLADNNVSDVFVDREGSLWAGTADGLTRVRAPTHQTWQSTGFWSTSLVWSVRADSDGTVWAGTAGDGLVRIDRDGSTRRFSLADGLPSDAVFTTYRSRAGELWVGTKLGIARLDGQRFVDMSRALGVGSAEVRTIFEEANGRFLVGTDAGLLAGTTRRVTPLRHGAGVQSGRVYNVTQDRSGRVWVAMSSLLRLDGDSLRVFRSAQGDTLPQVMDVYADSIGVWVGDYRRGLSLVRGDSMFSFPPQWTSVLDQVLDIIDDGRGALWLTSAKGVQRVQKADLLAWLASNPRYVPTRLFTKDDGLRSHDFAKSGSSSGGRGPDGRLWLPTTAGIVMLNPADLPVNGVVPQVIVERVLADGFALPLADRVLLPRGARRVRMEYTLPMLAAPAQVRMWYKLEGIDTAWRVMADPHDRSALYENLPRGTFRFLVRGQSSDGVPVPAPAVVTIVSRPPITRSAVFWGLLALLVIAVATAAYRWRIGRLRAQAVFLQRIIDERTESLAARERLEHQLLHAQKLESVGRLAGGVAHDLNNLLTAILGHTELAMTEPDVPGHLRADLGEVRTVTIRAAALTRQLLAFARKQVVQPRLLRLGDLVSDVETLIRRLLVENVEFAREPLEGDWLVMADPNQVEQVIVNLALNARDAMPDGGCVTVRTRAVTLDADFTAAHPECTPGDYVLLEVADTGVGMSAEVQSHLFEPFFTTKEMGKGTGLGLATTFGIVKQSGGHILVESHVDRGSTFRVYLPRALGDLAVAASPLPGSAPRGSEGLLLVEDEPAVRKVAERSLKALGYAVTTASDGVEALAILESARGDFRLVISDVRMPRLDGLALAARVRERWPDLKVVHMSGHSEALLTGAAAPGESVLRKPFTSAELAEFVRAAFDRGGAPAGPA